MNYNINKYKMVDLFAGAGGLSKGFEQTERFETIGAVEINKSAIETYVYNHGGNKDVIICPNDSNISDISRINFNQWKQDNHLDSDSLIVIGGPPCQGFSNANRQKNYLISGNNQLVKEFYRAIDEMRPVAFLMENVPSMNSEKHKFFVTHHVNNSRFAYSSFDHLNELFESTEKGQIKDQFLTEDSILLLETTNAELQNVIETIIKRDIWCDPIIENKCYLSRLRSILRKIKNSETVTLNKGNEKNEVNQLVNYLIEQLKNPQLKWIDLGIKQVVEQATIALQKLNHDTPLNSRDISNQLITFIDLNLLFLRKKELEEEKIHVDNILIKKADKATSIVAKVWSYNVVKYLNMAFRHIGYDIEMGVLTASDFGVPQSRKRFMIMGVQKDKVLNELRLPVPIKEINTFKVRDAIEDLAEVEPKTKLDINTSLKYLTKSKLSSPLQRYYRKNNSEGLIYNHVNTESRKLSKKRFEAIRQSNGRNFHSLQDDMKETYADASRTQNTIYLRLDYDKPSPTVVNVRKSMWSHPEKARAISIREAARLQSFPDEFVFKGSKDQQYQQVGNAVPPLLGRAAAESLLYTLGVTPSLSLKEELVESKIFNI